jgi:hypothetical protein
VNDIVAMSAIAEWNLVEKLTCIRLVPQQEIKLRADSEPADGREAAGDLNEHIAASGVKVVPTRPMSSKSRSIIVHERDDGVWNLASSLLGVGLKNPPINRALR